MSKSYSYYQEIHPTDNPAVKVFRRKDAKNWYARIRKPAGSTVKGKSPYAIRSLRTTSKTEAISKAADLYYQMKDKPSSFDRESSFQAFWDRFMRDMKRDKRDGSGHVQRIEGVFNRWMMPYINKMGLTLVEDWDIDVFAAFYDWRFTFYSEKKKALKKGQQLHSNAKEVPRVSTMRGEMNIAAYLLRRFYSYAGVVSPDFHYVVKRKLPRELTGDNRARRTRGFAIPPEQLATILDGLNAWQSSTAEDAPSRKDHQYARARLYWSLLFSLHSRCRMGTEVYNLKWKNLTVTKLGDDGRWTYTAWTEGKRGRRWIILDEDFAARFKAGWISRRYDWGVKGADDDDSFVFLGTDNNQLSAYAKTKHYLQSTLFKKFITSDEMIASAYHSKSYTGGDYREEPVRITPYDFRHTAISLAILNQGDKGMGELALLCGCSLAVMTRHYNNAQEMAHMRDLSRWAKTPAGTGGRFSKAQMHLMSSVSRGQERRLDSDREAADELGMTVSELRDIQNDSLAEEVEDAISRVLKNWDQYAEWLESGTEAQKKLVAVVLSQIPDGALGIK